MSTIKEKDVIKAFNWAQKNPEKSYEDYVEFISKSITKKELEEFKYFTYDKINLTLKGKEYEFLIIKNEADYLNLEKLGIRLAGNKGYYSLTPMPGEWYDGINVLHISKKGDNFFILDDWDLYEGHNGLYITGDDRLSFTFFNDNKFDEKDDPSYLYAKLKDYWYRLKKTHIKLWDNSSTLHGYINTSGMSFKPVDDLFNLID